MDFTRSEFLHLCGPEGYQEPFGEGYDYRDEIEVVLEAHRDANGRCLEIGCGNGYWTLQFLAPRFRDVLALDLLPPPPLFEGHAKIRYVQVAVGDTSCAGIEDGSIDFVWSFGVFCHLSNSSVEGYLRSIHRVLRPGGQALLMFPNWDRYRQLAPAGSLDGVDLEDVEQYREKPLGTWFYCDLPTAKRQVLEAGFREFEDTLPAFRDTLARVRK